MNILSHLSILQSDYFPKLVSHVFWTILRQNWKCLKKSLFSDTLAKNTDVIKFSNFDWIYNRLSYMHTICILYACMTLAQADQILGRGMICRNFGEFCFVFSIYKYLEHISLFTDFYTIFVKLNSTLWMISNQSRATSNQPNLSLTTNKTFRRKKKTLQTAREVIHNAQCSKHKVLYIWHTGEQLSERFPKHLGDIKNSQNKWWYCCNHIIQNNVKTAAAQMYHENKWICRLKTLAPHGFNTKFGDYAQKVYHFY